MVARNRGGRLELFVLGDSGHLFELAQSAPNGTWRSNWADLGPAPNGGAAGKLAVGRNLDGRLELFVRGSDNEIYHRWQQGAGGALVPAWASLGGSFQHDPVVGQNLDGRLELLLLGHNGHLFDLAQSAPNGGWWSSWADLGPPPPGGPAGNLSVARNLDGRLEFFLRGTDNKIYHRWQQGAGGALTPTWASMGGSFAGSPVAAPNQNGRLEVFVLGRDRSVHHDWQLAPSDGWA